MIEGLPPHNPTHVMRLDTDEKRARALTELLGEVFDPTETAVAAFEAEDGRTWRLEYQPGDGGFRYADTANEWVGRDDLASLRELGSQRPIAFNCRPLRRTRQPG